MGSVGSKIGVEIHSGGDEVAELDAKVEEGAACGEDLRRQGGRRCRWLGGKWMA